PAIGVLKQRAPRSPGISTALWPPRLSWGSASEEQIVKVDAEGVLDSLRRGVAGRPDGEAIGVGVVVPVLDPADQALPDLVLHGRRHLVEGRPIPRVPDRRPYALRVIEELEAQRGSELVRPVVGVVEGPAPPGGVP